MWIIVGALLGGLLFAIGGFEAAAVGAMLGAGAGGVVMFLRASKRAEEMQELRDQVQRLATRMDEMQASLERALAGRGEAPMPTASGQATAAQTAAPSPGAASPVSAAAVSTPDAGIAGAQTAALDARSPAIDTPAAAALDASPSFEQPAPSEPALEAAAPRRRSSIAAALGKAASAADVSKAPAAASARAGASGAPAGQPAARPAGARPAWLGWLLGGNPVVRVGIVVLFFGVAFLLKYASDRVQVPIQLRLAGVALGAIALLVIGFRLRTRRPDFGLVLQGGGVGLLYLTVFGALRVWDLLPVGAAFAMLAVIAAFSALLAVVQNALALAVLGVLGGFLAPVLASTGQGSHVLLFSYYALLNVAILVIAWMRAWRPLNLLGFAFTFLIGTAWGVTRYLPEHYGSAQAFLVLFVVFYIALPILYARKRAPSHRDYVDGTLVFGVPIVAFGLQYGLVREIEYGLAFSALALGLLYVLLAAALWSRRGSGLAMLVESFLALGIAFGTLALPLALDGRWSGAAWALEGAALVWIGVRQQRLLPRLAGYALQLIAGFFFVADPLAWRAGLPLANAVFFGAALIAAAALFSAWWTHKHAQLLHAAERFVPHALAVWFVGWCCLGFTREIDQHLPRLQRPGAWLIVAAALALLVDALARRWRWPFLGFLALGLAPAMAVALAAQTVLPTRHPLGGWGAVGWPLAIAALLMLLRRAPSALPARITELLHASVVWFTLALVAWQIGAWALLAVPASEVWARATQAALGAGALVALGGLTRRVAWPFGAHANAYLRIAGMPIAVVLVLFVAFSSFGNVGTPRPIGYLPIVNPLELAQIGALLALVFWIEAMGEAGLPRMRTRWPAVYWGLLGALAFVCLNGVLLRSLHHYAGIAFDLDTMFASQLVQAALSILWTVIALVVMVISARRALRMAWIVGASLLGVVVLKLLIVDLSGGIERIVSFIAVGILMLVIGYLAPLPPRRANPT